MAEVVGVVSAGVGIAAFLLEVTRTIKRLRSASKFNRDNAGVEVEFIIRRLEVLEQVLLSLKDVSGTTALGLAIDNCCSAYKDIDITLQQVIERLIQFRGHRWRIGKHTGRTKEDLSEARKMLDVLGVNMRLAIADSSPTTVTQSNYEASALLQQRNFDCARIHCHCSCHMMRRRSDRLWSIEYSPWSLFSNSCDTPQCTATRYRWSLQSALSRYGIPFKVCAGLEIIAGAGTYSLKPALRVDSVVRYTSPGFETIWRFKQGCITLSEAQDTFRELAKSGRSLKSHINPGGRNYVQELLCTGPAFGQHQDDQFKLLKFLVREIGINLATLDQKFLVCCVKWIGESCHITLLETILEYGFDPSCNNSPVYEEWPSTCSPSWISEQCTPDPFFVEYLAMLSEACPGFAGSTPLHDMVLRNDKKAVISLLSRPKLLTQKNFLGQTALHLAIGNLDVVQSLIDAGHDMNVTDRQGNTPLMYAAAIGDTSTVELLLSKGADPFLEDDRDARNFIAYAAFRGQWQLITHALMIIQSHYSQTDMDYFVKLWAYIMTDCNITFYDHRGTDDNNLLHYIATREDAEILVKHSFRLFNLPNSKGQTAMFSLAHMLDVELIKLLLDNGADIHHVYRKGRTILFSLFSRLSSSNHGIWDAVDSIKVCLCEGLDIFQSDECRCACSPGGCFLPAAFDLTFPCYSVRQKPSYVWGLELISLVEETKGLDDSKRVLLGLLRRAYSDKVEITHVCCHRGGGIPGSHYTTQALVPENDIDEILDEEMEFISVLEDEMLVLASKPMEHLRLKWMGMLREKYNEKVDEYGARKREYDARDTSKMGRYVDYESDTYWIHINLKPLAPRPITKCLTEYIIWLEHQYSRSEASVETECQRQAWYERRLAWFMELMDVMEVSAEVLAEEVKNKIRMGSWEEPNVPDEKCIVDHFMASIRSRTVSADDRS
ncbi:hypothetical protein BJX64DRAFT_295762 [Aspergillus heterothallicus]